MRKIIEISPFPLLIIGTLGLLINEFLFDWGKTTVLIFASANITGLLTLGLTYRTRKENKKNEKQ
jgi:hypothetical protein